MARMAGSTAKALWIVSRQDATGKTVEWETYKQNARAEKWLNDPTRTDWPRIAKVINFGEHHGQSSLESSRTYAPGQIADLTS
jgi:hypothetical protein